MDSDPELEFIEKDSGMSSLGGSKDETPERRAIIVNEFFLLQQFDRFDRFEWFLMATCSADIKID